MEVMPWIVPPSSTTEATPPSRSIGRPRELLDGLGHFYFCCRAASDGAGRACHFTAETVIPRTPYLRAIRSFEVPAKQS
jgi:hypothetical protein